jgi:hypothetical protein
MRPEEPRAFADLKEVRMDDPEVARYWAEHLRATPEEIAEAVGKVGCNRTAVELYLGVPDHQADPSSPAA